MTMPYMPPTEEEMNGFEVELKEITSENVNIFREVFEGMILGYEKFPDPFLAAIVKEGLKNIAVLCAEYLHTQKSFIKLARHYKDENVSLHQELDEMRQKLMKAKLGK